MCLNWGMTNESRQDVDVTADDELSDEVLGSVVGGNPQKGPIDAPV